MASRMLGVLSTLATLALAQPVQAHAATITAASIERQGSTVELRFAILGRGLKWRLSIHRQELWFDFTNVRIELPPLPLSGQEVAPVAAVRAISAGGTAARIVIEVTGRTDYVVGQLPHELVLRVAPAGEVRNLGAPILTRMQHRAGPPQSIATRSRSSRAGGPEDSAVGDRARVALPSSQAADSPMTSATRSPRDLPAQIASSVLPGSVQHSAQGH
ncbi:MAG TPA: hypothetical protein VHS07_01290, partial [Candidatus Binataceae bacterium]|nr:hypothetical protein [Candidatus Binataceae bacterium]